MRIRVAHEHEFLDAAKRFDFETVRTLCEESPSLVNAQPSGRLSALHQAVLAADASMVKWLCTRGADPHAVSNDGRTPLDLCRQGLHDECRAVLFAAFERPVEAELATDGSGERVPEGVSEAEWRDALALRRSLRARRRWRLVRLAIAVSSGLRRDAAATAAAKGERMSGGVLLIERLASKLLPEDKARELVHSVESYQFGDITRAAGARVAHAVESYQFGDLTRAAGAFAMTKVDELAKMAAPRVDELQGESAAALGAGSGSHASHEEYATARVAFVDLSRASLLVASDARLQQLPTLVCVYAEEMQAAINSLHNELRAVASANGLDEADETLAISTLITLPYAQFVETPEGSAASGRVPPMSTEAFRAASAEELASRLLGMAVSLCSMLEEDVKSQDFDGARDTLSALVNALDEVVMGDEILGAVADE